MTKKIKIGAKKIKSRIKLFPRAGDIYNVTGEAKTELCSNRSATVEGYKSVLQYYDTLIKLAIPGGALTFIGKDLCITTLSEEGAEIRGKIESVEYDMKQKPNTGRKH